MRPQPDGSLTPDFPASLQPGLSAIITAIIGARKVGEGEMDTLLKLAANVFCSGCCSWGSGRRSACRRAAACEHAAVQRPCCALPPLPCSFAPFPQALPVNPSRLPCPPFPPALPTLLACRRSSSA